MDRIIAKVTSHHGSDGICNYDGAFEENGAPHDPPCFQAGEYVLEFKYDPCRKCGGPRKTVACERHAHLMLERIGNEIKSVLPVHQDTEKLQHEIDKELEQILG